MWVPRSVRGGAELDPVSSLQVIENLAYGDPSVGWVLMAAALAIGTGAAYLGDSAVEELFSGKRLPVIAGQGTRPGTAVTEKGGFRLSGSWSFASGIKHGTHIHTLGVIAETGEPRIFVLPVEKATLIDNWDVMGLRGTGSIDYKIESVFVPEEYTHFAVTEKPRRGGSLYTIGVIGFATICHSGWACGIGRRLLDELAANVRARGGRAGTQAASESFQEDYAKAEGTYRAARALVYETWSGAAATLERGEPLVRARAHAAAPWNGARDLGGARGSAVRLQIGRNDGIARGHDSASVPRHARGHAAHRCLAPRVSRTRPRARGPRTGQDVAISRARRRAPGVAGTSL